MDDPALSAPFAASLARLHARGMRLVVVHGGGPHINNLLSRLNIPAVLSTGCG
jgi:acetylglutamate kinase